MSPDHSKRAIPALFCIAAALAMAGAGFLLFDSRDDLLTSDPTGQSDSFVSYAVEPSEELNDPEATSENELDADSPSVDWEELATEGWEVLEPLEEEEKATPDLQQDNAVDVGETGQSRRQARGNATIVVITNFSRANVTINGEDYPAYSDDGENRGVRLPSGQQHEVLVEFGESSKLYRINLQPGERRLLMVELTGMRAGSAPRPTSRQRNPRPADEEEEEEQLEEDEGRITVYSRPRGNIFVGERNMNQKTPGTVDVDPGRHEVQVQYDDGEMSETKTVRVREGSRIKLFFRQSD